MYMSKVFLGVGHGGSDPGAVANGFKEAVINLTTANFTKEELVRHGVEVRMSRTKDENDPVADEVRECNAFKPVLAVDIHVNAGGGDGFEVFYYSGGGTSKVLASNINDEVKAIGQNSRGLKTKLNSSGKDYFGFIRDTNCPAVICEGFFIDNKNDLKDFDTDAELKKLGVAYAKGILKTLGIAYKPVGGTVVNKKTVKIKVDGKYYEFEGMLIEGVNYVKVREFEKAGYKIGFENEVATIDKPCCCK